MPFVEDDFSDSDSDLSDSEESPVLLGIPDGPISSLSDLTDAAVSRIGGLPAFLPSNEPPPSSSECKICGNLCELLVQIWCPFEDSTMDRALYVWGCSRAGCQGKDGSIRAWRGLRFNEPYAQKLAQKKKKQQVPGLPPPSNLAPKANPFSMSVGQGSNPFGGGGLGAQIFGSESAAVSSPAPEGQTAEVSGSNSESDSEDEELITAMASASVEDSPWAQAPSHPPLYLSTTSEYLPPPPKLKLPPGVQVEDPLDDDDGKGSKKDKNGSFWASETYENSLKTDEVFDRFTKRVSYEGEQCIRYELDGTPLPFASDKIFNLLFPLSPSEPLPVTKPDFKVVRPQKRSYQPENSAVSPCPFCKSKRVFECQLMPNLINVFASSKGKGREKMTDEERRKAVEKELKKGEGDDKRGMEWGTCLVFSCSKDCCTDEEGKFDALECWREEVVLVQWDT